LASRRGMLFIASLSFAAALILLLGLGEWGLDNTPDHEIAPILPMTVGGFVIGLSCFVPVIRGVLKRDIDLFEPIYAYSVSTFVYFVLVPAILLGNDGFYLGGVDYSAELARVLLMVMIALAGFYLGYYSFQRRERTLGASPLAQLRSSDDIRSSLFKLSSLLLFVLSSLVVLWLVIAEIPLSALWIFGEASYGDAFRLARGPQIGYLYGAREALPACLLLLVALRSGRRWPPVALLFLVFIGLFFAGSGARFRVLLLVLSFFVFYYLERGKRPGLLSTFIFVGFMFYFVIGAMGYYRGMLPQGGGATGLAMGQDSFGVYQAWDTFVDSSRIVVSTASAIRYVPGQIDYLWGKSFINFFTQPIPRFLWPDKPSSIGMDFFTTIWPLGTTLPFWSLFYLNFGPLGVLLGSALWGRFSRWIHDLFISDPANPFAQMQLALYFPFLIHMYGRGGDNFAFIAYGLIVVLLPVWLVWWVARKRLSKAASTAAMAAPV
jgi:oligosaccharide repeat unit polymerase